jgi:hypothetical protein
MPCLNRAREVFDLDAPISEIRATLGKDKSIKAMLRKNPGVRVPGAWDGFEITIRAILGQQISVKAATTLAGRIAEKYGERLHLEGTNIEGGLRHLFPTAERLMRARLQNIGLVRSRAETIRRVSAAVVNGELQFDVAQDPEQFCDALKSIKGVGDWTAQSGPRIAERINNEGRGLAALARLCRHAFMGLFAGLRRIDRCITVTLRRQSVTCSWRVTKKHFAWLDFPKDRCAGNRSLTGYIQKNRSATHASN